MIQRDDRATCAPVDVESRKSKISATSRTEKAKGAESAELVKTSPLARDPYVIAIWYALLPDLVGDFYAILLEGLQRDTWEVIYTFRYGKKENRKGSVYPADTPEFLVAAETHRQLTGRGLIGLRRVMIRGKGSTIGKRLAKRPWAIAARLPWLDPVT